MSVYTTGGGGGGGSAFTNSWVPTKIRLAIITPIARAPKRFLGVSRSFGVIFFMVNFCLKTVFYIYENLLIM